MRARATSASYRCATCTPRRWASSWRACSSRSACRCRRPSPRAWGARWRRARAGFAMRRPTWRPCGWRRPASSCWQRWRRERGAGMNGVVVVDKPGGLTSFDVVARVRRALGERRVGHTGTLDPMATGVLPICVGEATKLVPFLVGGDKEYEAEALLGVTTDSLDATGRVTSETNAAHVSRADVEQALQGFVGTIQQRPPMHSAVRVDGRRLYELAHRGLEVERAARPAVVH